MVTESVWDYPRPPKVEQISDRLVVSIGELVLAETVNGIRVLETSHPPTYYFPDRDVHVGLLRREKRQSFCEFKGEADYWSIETGGTLITNIGWSYPNPTIRYIDLKDHFAFYANRPAQCWVGDEQVLAQEGDFYGGWITLRIAGPFKGALGTNLW
ncbi:MAG: DUF427 domain-containing protein [Pseudomonadota bacterium]